MRARAGPVPARVVGSSGARFPHFMAEVSASLPHSDPAAVVRTLVQVCRSDPPPLPSAPSSALTAVQSGSLIAGGSTGGGLSDSTKLLYHDKATLPSCFIKTHRARAAPRRRPWTSTCRIRCARPPPGKTSPSRPPRCAPPPALPTPHRLPCPHLKPRHPPLPPRPPSPAALIVSSLFERGAHTERTAPRPQGRFVFSTWDAAAHETPARDARRQNCVTRQGTAPVGTPCHFPFQYKGQVQALPAFTTSF